MSEHDDTLLDEDLGDEEYDLGNDEEEALLADDYEVERQNSYKGEEETDDVLDLGVTDALDDLDGEDENIEFNRSKTDRSNDNDFYDDGNQLETQSKYYEQDEINEYKSEQTRQNDEFSTIDNINTSNNIEKGDLREKLQKNAKIYSGNGQGFEDDECEEAKERRNRFQNERTIVSSKMNNHIPDTLENVVTSEPSKLATRGRGRGRSTRGNRGGRFNTQNSGNFNPRFSNARNANFDNQPPPVCRPPLLETWPLFFLGVPNNMQNQQIVYQQQNSQVQPFQHYSPNGSHQGPSHFVDNRPQFNPNQFQNQVGPRTIGTRLDYGPRGGLSGSLQGPSYSHPSNQPPYVQMQPAPVGASTAPFQGSASLMQDNQARLMQNNQGPLLQGNPGGTLLGNLNSVVPGTSTAPLLQGSQPLPMQGYPRQATSQGPLINHPNVNQIPNQSPFENRPPFQEAAQFENRSVYDSRSGYSDQVPTSQFNTNTLPVPQQSTSNVPNVPLPPGHKILINPHFRGAVQSTNDARLAWDSTQQTPNLSSQVPTGQFSQLAIPYQNQSSYNQIQQEPPHYQQNYQQNKSDDPYAYFSDVWQENKPQKNQTGTQNKQYSLESSYLRDDSYESSSKYKSDQGDQKNNYPQDHRGIHQNYRDKDLSSKTRNDHVSKGKICSSTTYRENYDQNHVQKSSKRSVNTSIRTRLPQKRVSNSVDRPLRDLSPKRIKLSNRNLQEVRTVDMLNNTNNDKKDEENDPEMQEYRKKMEEQKRLREKILREKENRRKMEEREKKRLEARAERIATKEKRAEQRKVEMELIEQIRKPVEDMELTDHRPLPELKRLPGLKLSGQAFADIVMVFEFLHNFGETLGFDMESLPSLKSLQLALLNDEEAEEELLSVMTHLLVCAIEDPGIPQPARHTTGLGQSLRQADITHANISEVLRIYLYANATGEVKALTGVCLERERDKKFADHHQNGGDYACSGKNAQFYEHLHNNETWKMSERLRDKPFLALNPTHKAQMLAFLCNELLQNKAVIRQIEGSLETVAQLRKERFVLDTKIRKLRQLHSRKVRMEAVGVIVNKTGDTITIEKKEVDEEGNTTSTAVGTTPTPDEIHHEDEVEDMSENESEGTQPEEEEDKNLSGEELGKKLDKLLKQSEEQLQKLNSSSKQLRAHIFGQDRNWRRYWELACAGGIFVEAMESAEPEILELQAELDEKYKNVSMEEKSETKQEDTKVENRENEAPNDVKKEKKFNSSEQEADVKPLVDKTKSEIEDVNCKKEPMQNCENLANMKEEKKNDLDNSMTDAKTNVTSEEIKQETEIVRMDVDIKEETKKENDEADEDMKPAVKIMEDKIVETIPNGDKFNHVNNLHNGKELNGTFISNNSNESNWFSILPRETCDTPGPSTKQIFGIAEPTELRIPVFPPPTSPNYDRCDSPAPLILTQDEAAQLEYLKVHGLPPPGEAKPVPKDLRYGWWRITDVDTFQELLEHLHSRGVREKELKRTTWATMESFLAVTGKINVDPGNLTATELQATPDEPDTPIPKPDNPADWSEQVALRVDAQLLEQVEALEDKVANASMQIKGWKLPPRAGTEEAEEIEKLNEMEKISAVEQARQRLLSLEAAIERRYLKPPLGVCTGDPNLAALKAEQAAAANANSNNSDQSNQTPIPQEETTPRGLNNWREATARAHTSAQLAMALYMLEASIAWDKSIMKANCQFCHSGDNEDKLLLCDGCDRGYHTYCFRPKMENIPDGDWYCHECMNKATGERNCLVCGKRVGKNLVLCELCPRAYHTDCHNPVMPKMPRGKWYCSNCHSKQPKKRNSSRRSHTKGAGTRESESSDHPPASPTPSTASNTHVEDVSSSEPATPTASPRKEGNNRTLTKKQQRELAPCKVLLEQLEQQDEAWPFLLPVNTKQFPTYKKIIKTPMDLSTIKKKLQDSVYKSRDEFCADVRQMFINCEVFNEDDSPVGKAGHGMRSFFEMRWTEITGAPPPHPQTHS